MSVLRPCIVLFVALTAVTGLAYPLAITAAAQAAFPHQANGSLLGVQRTPGGAVQVAGSSLLGQEFSSPAQLWGRPSATAPRPYTALSVADGGCSGGSNLGPRNPALAARVQERMAALAAADAAAGYARPAGQRIPADLVTSSASGLDPHISMAAAQYQVERIARARGLSVAAVQAVVDRHTTLRWLGIFGEPVVNVLEVNLELDGLRPQPVNHGG